MKTKGILVILLALLISGCGVSQSDYDKLKKERDALQEQVNEQTKTLSYIEERVALLEKNISNTPQESSAENVTTEEAAAENQDAAQNTVEPVITSEEPSPPESAGGTVTADDIAILKEYTLNDSIGWYSRHFIIIQNNSAVTADITCSSLAYDAEGNLVGTDNAETDAVGAGCTSILVEAIETDKVVDHYETTIKADM